MHIDFPNWEGGLKIVVYYAVLFTVAMGCILLVFALAGVN